jgi:hypothetical protein
VLKGLRSFEDGKIKVRGTDARRRIRCLVRDAQIDVIKVLGKANGSRDFVSIPDALRVLRLRR